MHVRYREQPDKPKSRLLGNGSYASVQETAPGTSCCFDFVSFNNVAPTGAIVDDYDSLNGRVDWNATEKDFVFGHATTANRTHGSRSLSENRCTKRQTSLYCDVVSY